MPRFQPNPSGLGFLDHAGVTTLDIGFGGEDRGSQYHSIYDDFYFYTHFEDTDFVYGKALAQVSGTAVMRMADAQLLPYNFANTADTVETYVDEVKKLLTMGYAPADPSIDPAQLAAMTIVTASVMNTPDAYTLR